MRYHHIDPSRFRHSDREPKSKLKHQTARLAWVQLRGFILFGKHRTPAVKEWQRKLSLCFAKVKAQEYEADKAIDELVTLTNQIKEGKNEQFN